MHNAFYTFSREKAPLRLFFHQFVWQSKLETGSDNPGKASLRVKCGLSDYFFLPNNKMGNKVQAPCYALFYWLITTPACRTTRTLRRTSVSRSTCRAPRFEFIPILLLLNPPCHLPTATSFFTLRRNPLSKYNSRPDRLSSTHHLIQLSFLNF